MLFHSLCNLYNWRYKHLGNLPHVQELPEFQVPNPGLTFDYQLINVEDFNGVGESEPNPYFYQVSICVRCRTRACASVLHYFTETRRAVSLSSLPLPFNLLLCTVSYIFKIVLHFNDLATAPYEVFITQLALRITRPAQHRPLRFPFTPGGSAS